MKFMWVLCLLLLPLAMGNAKDSKGVIMTVDGEDIPTEEFLYLYNKNNQQQIQPQTLDEYLDVFEIYRLKVAEAKRQGVDTTSAFKKEMDVYKRELVEPYIADTVFFNSLVEIAAEREKEYVESSHIMIIRTPDAEKNARNIALIDSLHTALLQGADFIQMAKEFSQDKYSSDKGGYLGFTPAGTFPYAFETAVYETPEGEVSEVVESHVGWHIVKAGGRKPASEFNHPEKSYQEVKADVARKVSSPFDSRFHQIRANQIKKLKQKYPKVNVDGMSDDEAYNTLLQAEEDAQYKVNQDYRNLVDEYTNGSLLFEVSVENVWNKASNDTEGLENYFNSHRNNYKWDTPHAKGILVQAVNDSVADVVRNSITGMVSDSIVPFIKKNFKKQATADRFNVSKGTNAIIDNVMFGEAAPEKTNGNYASYFVIEGRLVENPEELSDVKASVINDYQELLEKEWIDSLKKSHKVEINKKELAEIRKKLKK